MSRSAASAFRGGWPKRLSETVCFIAQINRMKIGAEWSLCPDFCTLVTPKSWTRKCLCLFWHGFWLLSQPILLKFGKSETAQRRVNALAGIHFIQKAL